MYSLWESFASLSKLINKSADVLSDLHKKYFSYLTTRLHTYKPKFSYKKKKISSMSYKKKFNPAVIIFPWSIKH